MEIAGAENDYVKENAKSGTSRQFYSSVVSGDISPKSLQVSNNTLPLGDGSHLTRNDDRPYVQLCWCMGWRNARRQHPDWRDNVRTWIKVVGLFRGVEESLSSTSILKDHFRLGKYTKESKKPRPILVKFVQSDDVYRVLAKAGELKKPSFVKAWAQPNTEEAWVNPAQGKMVIDSIRWAMQLNQDLQLQAVLE